MKHVRRKWNIRDASNGAGLAVVERFECSQFVRAFENEIADFPNKFAALARRQASPRTGLECPSCRVHRAIDVFLVAVGNARNHRRIRRIEHVEQFSGCGWRPFAADEVSFWLFQPRGNPRTDFGFSGAGNVAVAADRA